MSDIYMGVNEKLLGHIAALRELSNFAFSHGINQELETGERRNLDRIGIRANDLIIAITEFVSRST